MFEQSCSKSYNLPLVDSALTISNVYKSLGPKEIVRNLSLQIGRGEILGLIGRPGVRPHIVLDLLSGAVSPTSGSIVFHGEDVTQLDYECRYLRGITQVLPANAIVPQFTLLENVLLHGLSRARPLFPRQGGRTDHDEALDLLKFVGLADNANCRAETLDTHHKWLLTMATALASRPLLLLLTDCGFDTVQQDAKVSLIKSIAKQGISILLVSRSWHPVMDVCNRIEILREGGAIAARSKSSVSSAREIVGMETMREDMDLDQASVKYRQQPKHGSLPGQMLQRSRRGYNPSSDY